MSGGVDSSVAAYLLSKQMDCAGVMLQLCLGLPGFDEPMSTLDARDVADRLGMAFTELDHTELFRSFVADAFVRDYEAGLTPNPCMGCNKHIKFGSLLQYALEQGFTHLATGHYARIRQDEKTGRYLLYKAADLQKDQSYFLSCLNQHQLAHTLLPLGELTKDQVREIAQQQGFINAHRKDSQDVCFIPGGDYRQFMEQYRGTPYPAGTFLDLDGKPVGQHKGAAFYTTGQRKGLGLAMGEPVYVVKKDMERNTVTVGPEEALFTKVLTVRDLNFIPFDALNEPLQVLARIRYRHKEQPATIYPQQDGSVRVVFDEPQRAVTAGQTAVFYDGDLVIGSGTIE